VNSLEDFLLDPEAFYAKWGKVPELPHRELEILVPSSEFLARFRERHIIHVHDSERNRRPFVCWTGRLETLKDIRKVLELWCVGTAASMEQGKDVLTEALAGYGKNGVTATLRVLENRYGVRLMSVEVDEREGE
jgi:hypothetical protein